MKKILFRADANPSIGTGDLMSLVSLSRYFEKEEWEPHFIIRNYKAGITIAEEHKLNNLFVIDNNISIDEEVTEINSYVSANGIDIIFFEITERTLKEYNNITKDVPKVCVCFDGIVTDDMALVVNWDVNANNLFDTTKYPDTNFLLGLEYVILPIEFDYEKIKNRNYSLKPETLLIAMGGADELNFTQKVVNVFKQNNTNLKLNIIVGSGYEYKKELEMSLKNVSFQFEIKNNVTNMFNEYMNCDVAVSAGGLTSYELIATKTPTILIATYEHQIARCIHFNNEGIARYLGFRRFDHNTLIEHIWKAVTVPYGISFKTNKIVEGVNQLL